MDKFVSTKRRALEQPKQLNRLPAKPVPVVPPEGLAHNESVSSGDSFEEYWQEKAPVRESVREERKRRERAPRTMDAHFAKLNAKSGKSTAEPPPPQASEPKEHMRKEGQPTQPQPQPANLPTQHPV